MTHVTLHLMGDLSLENNGGFSSIRPKVEEICILIGDRNAGRFSLVVGWIGVE